MSEKSPNLNLPYILAAQAQKHVTHNEAIRNLDVLTQLSIKDKDLTTPPVSPNEGEAYIVAIGATGDWAGYDQNIAAWQDGAWAFYDPQEGWVGWLRDEDSQMVYNGATWLALAGGGGSTSLNPANGGLVGVNATADTTNRLSVNAGATLLNHEGTDHQLKINKNAVANNASVVFQTGFSGRAEFGLTGDDDFHMKVSPDGTTFHEGIVIDKDTGEVTLPNTILGGGGASEIFHIQDQKAAGTNGGSSTAGAWLTRDLNTVLTNEITGASLSSNQITLPAGTYEVVISAPGYRCRRHKAKLRNITDGNDALIGTSEYAYDTHFVQSRSNCIGKLTITASTIFELQHRAEKSTSGTGFGVSSNFGIAEVYSDVRFWKVA